MLIFSTVGNDTSESGFRDDDPQSGTSTGKVYDLDAPGIGFSHSANVAVGTVARLRLNLSQSATLDAKATDGGIRISDFFEWYARISVVMTENGVVLLNDAVLDNRAAKGDGSLNCM